MDTPEITRELLRAYHERGDRSARERLVELHLPLVRALARRYPGGNDQLDDLVQVGAIGLIKAIDRFDMTRGVELTTYAIPTIIGELKRHFRDRGWAAHVPRGLKELSFQLSHLVDALSASSGRSPTVTELAQAAGVDEETVVEALEVAQAYSAVSLTTAPRDDDSDLEPLAGLGRVEDAFDASDDRALLRPGFDALDGRELKIMTLRFYGGLTQSEIARDLGISQMHVSRLIRRSLDKMRDGIERHGTVHT